VVALVLGTGCSFFTMQSPRGSPPECNESRTSPTLDTLATIAAPIIAYAIIASNNNGNDPSAPFFMGIAAFFVTTPVMAVTGTSAVYGFVKAGRCERAKRDYQQLMSAPPAYPPPMAPPPPGS
jgi:hypothetical protein